METAISEMAVSEMDFFVARKAEGDLCEAYIKEVNGWQ